MTVPIKRVSAKIQRRRVKDSLGGDGFSFFLGIMKPYNLRVRSGARPPIVIFYFVKVTMATYYYNKEE